MYIYIYTRTHLYNSLVCVRLFAYLFVNSLLKKAASEARLYPNTALRPHGRPGLVNFGKEAFALSYESRGLISLGVVPA